MASLVFMLNKAIGYLETIRITDFIDIGVIAFFIYKLLQLIRGSRTGQVIKGVLLLIGVLWLSSLLQLHALNYLLSKAMEVGILAIAIVFQPELRNLLEQFGSSSLKSVFGKEKDLSSIEQAISQTVEAYAEMSKSHTGALTVFERTSLFDDCIRTGTALDCAVSSQLLMNIFFVKAPLHDGAVIIRQGRIVGGGCLLPLSSNVNISKELGTRHRAGIGATEHSDAVVVICSEETGSISVAIGGHLHRHLAPETLRSLLTKELLADHQTEKGTWQQVNATMNEVLWQNNVAKGLRRFLIGEDKQEQEDSHVE